MRIASLVSMTVSLFCCSLAACSTHRFTGETPEALDREAAVEAECASMWLITDEANVSAQMLYQLEGATVEGTRTQFAWRGLSGG